VRYRRRQSHLDIETSPIDLVGRSGQPGVAPGPGARRVLRLTIFHQGGNSRSEMGPAVWFHLSTTVALLKMINWFGCGNAAKG